MQCEALEKVLNIARKNSKILLSPAFFEKICARLDIVTTQDPDMMTFKFGDRQATAVVINPQNCRQYKCFVQEGKNGVRIFEFINVLITLLTDEEIPPSPYEKMGQTAAFYCDRAIPILKEKFLCPS